uniref:Uncharacterized protein n=1 Tax=Anguilla anguilla TaxID=7936 RepID=A0A0E9QJI2_ANGAN
MHSPARSTARKELNKHPDCSGLAIRLG